MKVLLQKILAGLARKIVAKYKPIIIGITGSVGKTSSKEAIFLLVSQKFRAFRPSKNLNNEFGLPLAIIGSDSPGRSMLGWMNVLFRGLKLIIFKQKYLEVLVLEYGIDRMGDMGYLLSIARPHISVITSIGVSHYEFFSDPALIEAEKRKIVEALGADDYAVLNADNERAARQRGRTPARVVTYGVGSADIHAQDVRASSHAPFETTCSVKLPEREIQVRVPVLGTPHVSSILSALAVADILHIETSLIEKALAQYKAVPGRLNILGGIKRSVIIDDTYNAAPDSMREALEVFAHIEGNHKMLVLGDMLELGSLSDDAHTEVGARAAELQPQHLVTVGPNGRIIAERAVRSGLPEERVISFDTSDEAKIAVQDLMREGSIVLVKGSQGVRMEKIVKEVMAEPMRAQELLCRQYGKWLTH